ncbi:DUF1036 domain-containing protein [Leptolyngbya sp. FACHB-711]|uniref:DUF1036 domain-containing protein n=1 Tax=Leptolyngbya sp. FACHB-711 TaxID=2692813 RepID=UPI001685B208|nr:DUF1036 domain-containing protein [Leptolyngbya sp. FACHB-711]MBD2028283.1 DUF1036 domain-containing protein [Leptolyngbya sp. FACHB-711]
MRSMQCVSLIVFVVSTLFFQKAVSAQSYPYNPAYDNDDDGMMDMTPYDPGASFNFPNYPIVPNVPNGLFVCNKSDERAGVAYSAYEGQAWVRRGWIGVDLGECVQLTSDILTRYVYVYAEGSGGIKWTGERSICIHPTDAFALPPMSNCSSPYENRPFMEVDTGGSRGYVLNLLNP